jgi:KTSC domain
MAGNYLVTPRSTTTNYLKYYPEKKILEIGFRTNEIYKYQKVPVTVWKDYYTKVSGGQSSGKFFNEHIKEKYEFDKMT